MCKNDQASWNNFSLVPKFLFLLLTIFWSISVTNLQKPHWKMKYLMLVVLSALLAAHLHTYEDPLSPLGAVVKTMVNHCGSVFARVSSMTGKNTSLTYPIQHFQSAWGYSDRQGDVRHFDTGVKSLTHWRQMQHAFCSDIASQILTRVVCVKTLIFRSFILFTFSHNNTNLLCRQFCSVQTVHKGARWTTAIYKAWTSQKQTLPPDGDICRWRSPRDLRDHVRISNHNLLLVFFGWLQTTRAKLSTWNNKLISSTVHRSPFCHLKNWRCMDVQASTVLNASSWLNLSASFARRKELIPLVSIDGWDGQVHTYEGLNYLFTKPTWASGKKAQSRGGGAFLHTWSWMCSLRGEWARIMWDWTFNGGFHQSLCGLFAKVKGACKSSKVHSLCLLWCFHMHLINTHIAWLTSWTENAENENWFLSYFSCINLLSWGHFHQCGSTPQNFSCVVFLQPLYRHFWLHSWLLTSTNTGWPVTLGVKVRGVDCVAGNMLFSK